MASIAAGVDESAKTIKEFQPPVNPRGGDGTPFVASIKKFTANCIKATGLWPSAQGESRP